MHLITRHQRITRSLDLIQEHRDKMSERYVFTGMFLGGRIVDVPPIYALKMLDDATDALNKQLRKADKKIEAIEALL